VSLRWQTGAASPALHAVPAAFWGPLEEKLANELHLRCRRSWGSLPPVAAPELCQMHSCSHARSVTVLPLQTEGTMSACKGLRSTHTGNGTWSSTLTCSSQPSWCATLSWKGWMPTCCTGGPCSFRGTAQGWHRPCSEPGPRE